MKTMVGSQSPIHVKFLPDRLPFPFDEEKRTEFGKATASFKVGKKRVDFFPNGNMVVHSSNKEVALDIINSIRFSMLLLGSRRDVLFDALTIDDIFYAKDNGDGSLKADITDPSFIRKEAIDWDTLRILVGPYMQVSASQIEVICRLADEIYRSDKKDSILLFFECYSDRQHSSHNVSFMQGWVCIELSIYLIIEKIYGPSKTLRLIDQKGKPYSKKVDDMTAFEQIQFLQNAVKSKSINFRANGLLPVTKKQLDRIDVIRKKRNDIFHGDRKATKREAKAAYTLATKAMWNLMRLGNIDYRSRLKEWRASPVVSLQFD